MPISDDEKLVARLKAAGLTPAQAAKIRRELEAGGSHDLPEPASPDAGNGVGSPARDPYAYNDLDVLQRMAAMQRPVSANIRSIDELLERDKQREEDGFPRKIDVGRLIKPGKSGKQKVVIVPTTVEEKFLHDTSFRTEEDKSTGGAGDGEEGEVIGEQPVRAPDVGGGTGPGQGEGGQHEVESSAYDLGRILTEKFQLPNLKDKGKKRSLTRYTYDLTDRHRGFGQLLDKKATLRKIVETNIHLGNLPDVSHIDPTRFLVAPADKVYRILSREKDYESQAMVFFLRDYSGSMEGKSTQLVVAQHVLIYSWLLYQYAMQVETRFILHDTQAAEVPDFYTYYNSKVAGGTLVSSAYTLVNQIVQKENLTRDYNIYIFHGTDGDDWDAEGKESLPQLKAMLAYASRVGITIAEHGQPGGPPSEVERYIKNSGLLEEKPRLIRLDVMQDDAGEPRVIEGIKKLISE
jgi:hypothetical protein